MAKNLNSVNLSGNLVADPELLQVGANETSKCVFRLAVNNGESKDKREYPVTYIDVVAWNGRGENAAKYLKKGRFVIVAGRLDYREWESQDGSKRSKHELTATDIEFGPLPKTVDHREDTPAEAQTDDIPF